jgi:hypothetical protein
MFFRVIHLLYRTIAFLILYTIYLYSFHISYRQMIHTHGSPHIFKIDMHAQIVVFILRQTRNRTRRVPLFKPPFVATSWAKMASKWRHNFHVFHILRMQILPMNKPANRITRVNASNDLLSNPSNRQDKRARVALAVFFFSWRADIYGVIHTPIRLYADCVDRHRRCFQECFHDVRRRKETVSRLVRSSVTS